MQKLQRGLRCGLTVGPFVLVLGLVVIILVVAVFFLLGFFAGEDDVVEIDLPFFHFLLDVVPPFLPVGVALDGCISQARRSLR